MPRSTFSSLSRALLRAAPPARLVRAAIAVAAVLLTVWAEWLVPPQVSFFGNEQLRDAFVRMRSTEAPEPRILVVDIDEASMKTLGPWPWPRARIADLVEILISRYDARGVALDFFLSNPADAAGDARLSLLAMHGPVVLAQAFDYDSGPTAQLAVPTAGVARAGLQVRDAAGGVGIAYRLLHVRSTTAP